MQADHLVITADDFGLAVEVNEAVELAHCSGILTATSLMVGAPAAADAVRRAQRMPNLRVGLHLTLVDGAPVSPRHDIPDLIDSNGMLRSDMVRFGAELALRPRLRRQMAIEIAAQFEAFRKTGLALDHVNSHRHFHVHPVVAGLVIAVGRCYGMSALRVPREPVSVLAQIERPPALGEAAALWPWAQLLGVRASRAQMVAPRATFGLRWSGAMNSTRLLGLVAHRPAGLIEIYTHPAVSDRFEGSANGYRYIQELAALTDPRCRSALAEKNTCVGGYSDYRPERAGAMPAIA
jgi:hopanoid biosynthesis associated protein HpnK